MGVARTRAERIAAAKAMFARGLSKRQIARELQTSARTVGRWVGTSKDPPARRRRQPEPADVLLEAGLARFMRFGSKPNSVTWNATRARKRGADAWRCHLEGWGPRGTTVWRSWPQAHDVTLRYGSWKMFHERLDEEVQRRRDDGDPYRPRPVPRKPGQFATLAAHARGVNGAPRYASEDDPITPGFAVAPAGGVIDLRGAAVREGVAIVGDLGTRRSPLLAGVVQLDRLRHPPVVVVQRADKPLIASGLPRSDLIDLEDAIELGYGAIVRSDEPDVRLMAIGAAAQASAKLTKDVYIAVDDADDLMADLARFMIDRPVTAHMAIVWSPQLTEFDTFVWAGLPSRAVTTIENAAVNEFYRRPVDPDLFHNLSLPRPY